MRAAVVALGDLGRSARMRYHAQALAAGDGVAAAQRILIEEIAPIDDIRSTAEYRRRVAANLLARFWEDTHRG